MYTIKIILQCPDEYTEVLPDSLESAEHSVEERISLVLSELFGTVLVEVVTITYEPSENKCGGIFPPAA